MTDGMVALLPVEASWCKIDIPHVTIIYLEDVDNLEKGAFYEISKKVSSIALATSIFSEKVIGVKIFGEEEKVDVLELQKGRQLLEFKELLDRWDSGTFPEFRPHATIGKMGSTEPLSIPLILTFDRIAIGWGDDYFVFRFKS